MTTLQAEATQEQTTTTVEVETVEQTATEQVAADQTKEAPKRSTSTYKSKKQKEAEAKAKAAAEVEQKVEAQPETAVESDKETLTQVQSEVKAGSIVSEDIVVGTYALNEFTKEPTYGTTHSACFDIRINLAGVFEQGDGRVSVYTRQNQKIERRIERDNDGRLYVELRPNERAVAPTGAIFDIPVGYSLKVHPRSGTSLKQGINLINQEAVIDADYVEELFILLVNSSENHVKIYHDERYAQGELQEVIQTKFTKLTERPQPKSERSGGLGHTGVK